MRSSLLSRGSRRYRLDPSAGAGRMGGGGGVGGVGRRRGKRARPRGGRCGSSAPGHRSRRETTPSGSRLRPARRPPAPARRRRRPLPRHRRRVVPARSATGGGLTGRTLTCRPLPRPIAPGGSPPPPPSLAGRGSRGLTWAAPAALRSSRRGAGCSRRPALFPRSRPAATGEAEREGGCVWGGGGSALPAGRLARSSPPPTHAKPPGARVRAPGRPPGAGCSGGRRGGPRYLCAAGARRRVSRGGRPARTVPVSRLAALQPLSQRHTRRLHQSPRRSARAAHRP